MYISASINDHAARALLDTRATLNFISEKEAKRLGLNTTQYGGTIKAVNLHTKPFAGTTQGVHVKLETWNRKLDFSIVPMDDFAMIVGMEFFDKIHVFPLLATNYLSIFDGSKACVVLVERAQPKKKTLSVMQCIREFKKDLDNLVFIQ